VHTKQIESKWMSPAHRPNTAISRPNKGFVTTGSTSPSASSLNNSFKERKQRVQSANATLAREKNAQKQKIQKEGKEKWGLGQVEELWDANRREFENQLRNLLQLPAPSNHTDQPDLLQTLNTPDKTEREGERDVVEDREGERDAIEERERERDAIQDRERERYAIEDREGGRDAIEERERQTDVIQDRERHTDATDDRERETDAIQDRERHTDATEDRERESALKSSTPGPLSLSLSLSLSTHTHTHDLATSPTHSPYPEVPPLSPLSTARSSTDANRWEQHTGVHNEVYSV
jgi:hypothetical protein